MAELDIVVLGELNVDLILQSIPSFPEMGKEKIAGNISLTLGSASAIFAANVARLGAKVGFLGKLGTDPFAELVLSALTHHGVDCTGIIQDHTSQTGITVVMAFPDDSAGVTFMGAMEEFTLEDIDFSYLQTGQHMHLSSYYLQLGLRKGCRELFKRAKQAGLTTSFDPGWDPIEAWGSDILTVLKHVDILLPNEQEAMNISGGHTPEAALDKLSCYCGLVVIKLGKRGAICRANGETLKTRAYDVTSKDTTGAGDSFNSGFIYEWLKGSGIRHCLRAATACGALATTRIGGATESPTIEELSTFLATRTENIFDD